MTDYYTHPSSHPEWHGTEPARERSYPEAYRCLDCPWFGKGVKAYEHHKQAHHRIVLVYREAWGPICFSCCPQKDMAEK